MKTKTLFILFIFSVSFSYSQQTKIDSLKKDIEGTSIETEKLRKLYIFCDEIVSTASLKGNEKYILDFINLSKKNNNDTMLFDAYLTLSTYYIYENKLDSALFYLNEPREISYETNNLNQKIYYLTQMFSIYDIRNDYDRADSVFYIGEDLINNRKETSESGGVFFSLFAQSLYNRGDDDKAIEYYIKAIDIAAKNDDYQTQARCYRGLSWLYIDRKQYLKSKKYLLEALKVIGKRNDYLNAVINRILGVVYLNLNNFEKAIFCQKTALNFFTKNSDIKAEFDILFKISFLYFKKGEYGMAILFSNKAIKVAKKTDDLYSLNSAERIKLMAQIKSKNIKVGRDIFKKIEKDTLYFNNITNYRKGEFLSDMVNIYSFFKEYKKALNYSRKLAIYNDSVYKAKNSTKIAEIETKYQTEKKEKENLQLKKEKAEQTLILQKEKQREQYMLSVLFALLLFIVIFAYYYRRNRKQKALIENLQKELHHRIKNNLSVIDTFIEVAKEEFKNPAFNNKLTELQNRIAGINEVHKQLYDSKDITNIHLKKYIKTLADNVANSFGNENVELVQDIDDSLKLYADKSFPVGLIINEFITNSFKYAFGENTKGKIKIKIQETKSTFLLMLSDNGKGLPEDFDIEKTETFGMRIMKLLAEQLKGTFQLDSTNGVTVNIQFPK